LWQPFTARSPISGLTFGPVRAIGKTVMLITLVKIVLAAAAGAAMLWAL
jgi:hypothetical protein